MRNTIMFSAILALVLILTAASNLPANDADNAREAEISAITNSAERADAWYKYIPEAAAKNFSEADEMFDRVRNDLTANRQASLHARLAVLAVQRTSDAEKVKAHLDAIPAVQDPTAETDADRQRFDTYKVGRLCWAISQMTRTGHISPGHPGMAEQFLDKYRHLMSDSQIVSLEMDLLIAAANERDRPWFDRQLENFLKHPNTAHKISGLTRVARSISNLDNELAERLLHDTLADTEIEGRLRFNLYQALGEVLFERGEEAEGYQNWRNMQKEILARADEGELQLAGMMPFARAYEFGDRVLAGELVRRALEINPDHHLVRMGAAQGAFLEDDFETAAGHLWMALQNERLSPDIRNLIEALLFFAAGNSADKFDQTFADKNWDSEAKLRLLYRASEFLYRCDQWETCRDIYAYIRNEMFVPFEEKRFTVQYDANAPKTADGWTYTPAYRDWSKMETRFVPHGDILDFSIQLDVTRLLKDAEQPKIPEGYQTGVYFLCNDEGLHIYIRADDPNVEEIVDLKRNGGGFDINFKAGDDGAPYNIWFQNLPSATGGTIVDWAAPTRNYTLTRDIFERDAVTTPEGIAAHVFVPWLFFCDQLPFDGRAWRFGMVRGIRGVGRLALTGNHQEFGRLVYLDFDLTPEQRNHIMRRIALMAFNYYNTLRRDPNEFILTWRDSVLGDPVFFEEVLEPMLEDLDEAGAKLTNEQPLSDADINEIFAKYVPDWKDIKYVVAEKRAEFLRNRFLQ